MEVPPNDANRKRTFPFEDAEIASEKKRHAVGDEIKVNTNRIGAHDPDRPTEFSQPLSGHETIDGLENSLMTSEVDMEVAGPSLQELTPMADVQGTCKAMHYADPAEGDAMAEFRQK